ncbi:hypothetical protein AGMMS50268_09350 [Spirochaetia bacterium]|nr:hypothetical protein AGMMS50268_09350 [Spirochaetia bacterium]
MGSIAKMVYDDPEKMHLLAVDLKECLIKAATATVNIKAALARKEAIKNIKDDFTIRNNFTTAQVQFTPMPEGRYSLSAIQSVIGITEKASYMARQEEGGEQTPSKGRTLAIASDVARGGSVRHTVISPMRVGKLTKKRRVHGESNREYKSQKAWMVARAFVAFTEGLFLPLGGNGDQRNLHEVVQFQKTSGGAHFESMQVYKFDMEKTITSPQPWLLPACEKVEADSQDIFNSQMKKQGM